MHPNCTALAPTLHHSCTSALPKEKEISLTMGRPLRPWPANALAGYEVAMGGLAEIASLHMQISEAILLGKPLEAAHLLNKSGNRLTRAVNALERARRGERVDE